MPHRTGKLELLPALLQRGDRIGIGHPLKRRRHELLQARDAFLVDTLDEEFQIVAAFVEQRREDVLQKRFRQIRVGR
jgi:hypothetical protein